MIIYEEIILKNFRRHIDASFNFNTNKEKNLNIILANNGVGKSTLFDAFTWGFFEVEDHLKIDKKYEKESESLVNTKTFFKLPEGGSIKTEVILFLRDTTKRYRIERSLIHYKKNGQRVSAKKTELKIQENDLKGNKGWGSPMLNPEHFLDQIIPKDLRQFFFFDGEKLREHFEGDTSSFLKEKIEQVSRIKYINACIEVSENLQTTLTGKIARLSGSSEVTELAAQIEISKNRMKEHVEREKELMKKYHQLHTEKKKTEQEIYTFGNVDAKEMAQKKCAIIQEEIARNKRYYDEEEKRFKKFLFERFEILALKKEVIKTQDLLDAAILNKEAPPPITKDFIERLLNVHKECICGTSLKNNDEHRKQVEELLNNTEIAKSINFGEGQVYLDSASSDAKSYQEDIKEYKKQLRSYESKNESLNAELMEESNKVKNFDSKKLNDLKTKLAKQTGDMERTLKDALYYRERKEDAKNDASKEEKQFKILTKNNKKLDSVSKKKGKVDSVIDEFKLLKEKIIDKNKTSLISKTETYFRSTCTSKEFGKIRFSEEEKENYELFIEDKDDSSVNLLRTLSAGESQIFAFSFAAALREVTRIKSPFIIDTPLGKIDPEYRDEIMNSLPLIFKSTQITLLVTSSEYTERVKKLTHKLYPERTEYEVHRKYDDTRVNSDKGINIYVRTD